MKSRSILGPVFLTIVLVLAACGNEDPNRQLVGYEIDPAPEVGHLSATDASHGGEAFPLRAEPGRLLIAFLGFTNCPDACPTALAEVQRALEELGDDARAIDVAMLTVDPQRDTPEVLTAYVQRFVDDAHALRVEDSAQLQRIVDDFGATYDTEHDHDGSTTDVGHTDYIYLLDDSGAVALTWTAEMTVDDLVNDLRIMLESG